MTGRLLHALTDVARSLDTATVTEHLREVARIVAPAQPTMAPLLTCLDRLFAALLDSGADGVRAELATQMETHRHGLSRVAELALPAIATVNSVASISWSSTVAGVLERFKRPLKVVLSESRPGSEGRRAAERARAMGHQVVYVADSGFPAAAASTDALLLGADALTPSVLVNKIGSRGAARECNAMNTPVYVLIDPSKIVGSELAARLRIVDEGPDELWPDPLDGIRVQNPHFETVPLALITKVLGISASVTDPAEVVALVASRPASRHWNDVPQPERGRSL